ncbi:aspartyl protease family protein [Steroidobacter gossypii]|uniref:aspartyl protease family protein n=1 Tax=Steroidobacter gossypii TaxID=2805490 RepID=UPI002AC31858|nr:aspartyl protease family protein [Steroidobacter gossypii]
MLVRVHWKIWEREEQMLNGLPRLAQMWLVCLCIGGCGGDVSASHSASSTPTITSVPLILRDNSALVSIRIANSDVPVQLDTGNFTSVSLSQEILDRAGAQAIDGVSERIDAQGNKVESPRFHIDRMQLGNVVFNNVNVQLDVHAPSYQPYQIGQQGFLGTALLKGYRVIIDYPKQAMTLIPAQVPLKGTACQGTEVEFDEAWAGEPATLIETDLGTLTVWWDTGAGGSALTKRFIEKAGRSDAQTVESSRLLIGGDDFGPWTFQVWENLVLPPGFDGFIGDDFFSNHVVCMDFPAKRLLVRKAPKQASDRN